ncbi:MAG: hypothetical protein ACE14Q_08480 [Acidobacteriota bacterium]|nr:hypothetical protein [Thermoanaerobaculaceae bacterium]
MKQKELTITLVAFIGTILFAVYQGHTGPTYPVRGKTTLNGAEIKYKLYRSEVCGKDAEVKIEAKKEDIKGSIAYKRYPTNDDWVVIEMKNEKGFLIGSIPTQPPAGKIEYQIQLREGEDQTTIPPKPVIMRFRGRVPFFIMIPHIVFIFLGLLFAFRVFFKVILNQDTTKDSIITFTFLLVGGLILGPIVQKYAFGAFWTGYPFGQDMTDNKTLVAVLCWIPALFFFKNNQKMKRWAALFAFIAVLVAFGIPHSHRGSELDWSKLPKNETIQR